MEKFEGVMDEFDGEVMTDIVEGDMRTVSATADRQKSKKEGRAFGMNDWYLWPNGVVPYTFGFDYCNFF